jgi:hypothetical protein
VGSLALSETVNGHRSREGIFEGIIGAIIKDAANAAAAAKEKRRREEADILRSASLLIIRAQEFYKTLVPTSDMGKLIYQLISYLQKRKTEGNYSEWEKRGGFIESCLNAIINKDFTRLENLLQESNIKLLKGVFSKRLYNTVKPFQFFARNRWIEKNRGINLAIKGNEGAIRERGDWCTPGEIIGFHFSMPKVLMNIIDEYDKSFNEKDSKEPLKNTPSVNMIVEYDKRFNEKDDNESERKNTLRTYR